MSLSLSFVLSRVRIPSSGKFSKGSFLITSIPSPPPVSFLDASATEYSWATWYWKKERTSEILLFLGNKSIGQSSSSSQASGYQCQGVIRTTAAGKLVSIRYSIRCRIPSQIGTELVNSKDNHPKHELSLQRGGCCSE